MIIVKQFTVCVNEPAYSTGLILCWILNFVKWNVSVSLYFAIHERFSFLLEEGEF